MTPRSKGSKAPGTTATPAVDAMPVYPKRSQSSKKRKVFDLTQEDEEDEEAENRAQDALAGKNPFIPDIEIGASILPWNNYFPSIIPIKEEHSFLTISGIDTKSRPARKKKDEEPDEKRLKRFRQKPPQSYLERLGRVKAQRMFLIDRTRTTSEDGTHEEEVFDLAGSTGNIYQITISKIPRCTCPDAGKGNQCKHIIYVCLVHSENHFVTDVEVDSRQCPESPGRPCLSTCVPHHRAH